MSEGVGVWAGLGQRPGAKPAPDPAEDERDERGTFEHRVIPAAGAPSVLPAVPVVSPFTSWQPAGSADPATDDSAAATHEENTMPKQTRHRVDGSAIRLRFCQALLQVESKPRDELIAELSLDARQVANVTYQLRHERRIEKVTPDGGAAAYKLTALGRRYLAQHGITEGAAPATRRKPGRPAKAAPAAKRAKPGRKVRRPRAASAELAQPAGTDLAIRTFEPVVERSFRCAVFSDGAFHLAKNGQAIDLSPTEHAEMLRYIERMAEQPGA